MSGSDIPGAGAWARLGEHAVVIGGSMAGLLTARVLSDHFDRVTIFEADTPPEQAVPRTGVPQGHHIHGLLAGGAAVINRYFPALHDELVAAGAEYGDSMLMTRMYIGGRWNLRLESGNYGYVMSRPLLEAMVRKHCCALGNVQLRVNTSVSGYLSSADHSAITGVTLAHNDEAVAADFVADVRGRSSTAPEWLKALGYAPPERTTVGIDVGYVTFEVPGRPSSERDWRLLFITQKSPPEDTRAGGLFCIEGGRYLVTAGGFHKDYPPTHWAGFLDFMKSLPQPHIYREIKDLQPLGAAKEYRFAHYLRRHYERLDRFPRGLIVLGDAICSFNPIYGQGMTVAAKEADFLADCLAQCARNGGNLDNLAPAFFKGAARIVDVAWNGVTVEDFKYPQTRGARPRGYAIARWLNDRFFALSGVDEAFAIAFNKVLHLAAPPGSILKPKYLLKAIFNGRRQAADYYP
jgi:2-polyprenyl-6-methoxyphenol hydroxylase-like FAD-dependent oxidoreductase